MTLSELFSFLGAPLVNPRWSWGAVRPADGAVFLRVWQDEQVKVDGCWYTQISDNDSQKSDPSNLGRNERQKHVQLVRNGAKCYMIMCQAADPQARPRTISTYNQSEVFLGGRVIQVDGDDFLERFSRIPVANIRRNGAAV